ncbi:MAG: UDP-N-acetylmuramoyl-L-alanine--D-glutamate ligase, partial [Firmicutes bacterium]|nr:UDP-N-acetylmuramoyl-L-alanine--D-glutamate ligase [Bacillota bacterium]
MILKGKKTLVVGAGKTGLAVTRFLLRRGAVVTLTDSKKKEQLGREVDTLTAAGVRIELGHYPEVRPGVFDLVVVSPGVPPHVP